MSKLWPGSPGEAVAGAGDFLLRCLKSEPFFGCSSLLQFLGDPRSFRRLLRCQHGSRLLRLDARRLGLLGIGAIRRRLN